MSLRRRQLQSVMRELCGALLLLCVSLLPALLSEPRGDELGRVESKLARGERDAALHASSAVRPAQLARVRAATQLPSLLASQQHATSGAVRLAADGGDASLRPAPSLRCARYRPRSDCGDHERFAANGGNGTSSPA